MSIVFLAFNSLFQRLTFVKVNASSEMNQDEEFLKAEQLLQKIKAQGENVGSDLDTLNSEHTRGA